MLKSHTPRTLCLIGTSSPESYLSDSLISLPPSVSLSLYPTISFSLCLLLSLSLFLPLSLSLATSFSLSPSVSLSRYLILSFSIALLLTRSGTGLNSVWILATDRSSSLFDWLFVCLLVLFLLQTYPYLPAPVPASLSFSLCVWLCVCLPAY